jgi:hypothetical protein
LERQLKTDAALRDWYLDALPLDSALEVTAESAEIALSLPPAAISQDSHRAAFSSCPQSDYLRQKRFNLGTAMADPLSFRFMDDLKSSAPGTAE